MCKEDAKMAESYFLSELKTVFRRFHSLELPCGFKCGDLGFQYLLPAWLVVCALGYLVLIDLCFSYFLSVESI